MNSKRRYVDSCGMAHALNLVGERWALLVVRELVLGPKRFTDLRAGLPGISPNVLTQRLGELEEVGVVTRRRLAPPASVNVYELTEWGYELEPIIKSLGRWGARSPHHPREDHLSVNSVVLSLRTMFDPALADGWVATLELRVDGQEFQARVADRSFSVERGSPERPDAVLEAAPMMIAALAYDGYDLAHAVSAGEVKISGDTAVVERFFSLFHLPQPASTG